jgi:hypothetical protein
MTIDCLQEDVHIITQILLNDRCTQAHEGYSLSEYKTYTVYYMVLDDEYINTKKESKSGRTASSNKQSEKHGSIFDHAR